MVFDHYSATLSALDMRMIDSIPPGGNWKDLPDDIPSARVRQIRESYSKGGGSRSTYYGRLQWDRPAYTVPTYFNRPGNGCFIHPESGRLISLREGARIQSFPDHYRFHGPIRARYAQIGNAVPPLLAYQVASALGGGTFVDLFCGAGGLSLGFQSAGFEPVVSVDYDRHALETYAFNLNNQHDGAVLQEDLSTPAGMQHVVSAVRSRLGNKRPTIISGGPPCQGFSTAGKCDLNDERNKLVFSFLAIVQELQPEMVLIENVSALLWQRHAHLVAEIRQTLMDAGYYTALTLAHTESYGVPQLRRRMLLLGARDPAALVWPAPGHETMEPAFPKYQAAGSARTVAPVLTLRDAIGDLALHTVHEPDTAVAYRSEPGSPYQSLMRGSTSIKEFVGHVGTVPVPVQLVLENA